MKKFIFTLLTLCVSITVDAQSWIVDTIAGDELLGTKSCIGYAFQEAVTAVTAVTAVADVAAATTSTAGLPQVRNASR